MKSIRKLVVDASIARAAGDVSLHPVSASCRETLRAVESLYSIFCPILNREWKKHESAYSRSWRVKMVQQGRVIFISEDTKIQSFLDHIEQSTAGISAKRAMEKDAHLVSASMLGDKIILALDETVRKLFIEHCFAYKGMGGIIWSNPMLEADKTLAWLKGGAKRGERSMSVTKRGKI